jgi:hypothetical protein
MLFICTLMNESQNLPVAFAIFTKVSKCKNSTYVKAVVQSSIKRGIEIWQVNFKITPTEVNLVNYFETTKDFLDSGAALIE